MTGSSFSILMKLFIGGIFGNGTILSISFISCCLLIYPCFMVARYVLYNFCISSCFPFIKTCSLVCAANLSIVWLFPIGMLVEYSQSSSSPLNSLRVMVPHWCCGMMVGTILNFTFLYFLCITFGVGNIGSIAVTVGCGSSLVTLGSAGNVGVSSISGLVVTWKMLANQMNSSLWLVYSLMSGDSVLFGCCKAVMKYLPTAATMSVDAAVGSQCLLGKKSTMSEFIVSIVSITQHL